MWYSSNWVSHHFPDFSTIIYVEMSVCSYALILPFLFKFTVCVLTCIQLASCLFVPAGLNGVIYSFYEAGWKQLLLHNLAVESYSWVLSLDAHAWFFFFFVIFFESALAFLHPSNTLTWIRTRWVCRRQPCGRGHNCVTIVGKFWTCFFFPLCFFFFLNSPLTTWTMKRHCFCPPAIDVCHHILLCSKESLKTSCCRCACVPRKDKGEATSF